MTNSFRGGFLRDDATGALATTTITTGATFSGGFLRAPTGELVTTTTTAGATFSGGFLRAPNGALVTSTNAGVQTFNGLLRDSAGALVTTTTTAGALFIGGHLHAPGGALVLAGGAASAYAAAVLAEASLVSYWRLNDPSGTVAADSKGANAGAYTGGFTLNQPGAVAGGGGVLLDGTSGYVNVPDAANLRITGDITLEAWVNPTDRTNFWFLVAKDVGNVVHPYEWRLEQTTGVPSFVGNVPGTTAPATGAWTHLALAYSGTTITNYLNGVANGSGTRARSDTDGGTALKIGTRDDLFSFFKGSLAEVAVYNTALSGASIAAHYAAR